MTNREVGMLWDTFMISFPYTDNHLNTIVSCCKRYCINPVAFANNLFFITGKKIDKNQEIIEPTYSIRPHIKYFPPGYSPFFVASFPDAILWFMESYQTDIYKDNIYFKELQDNLEKYYHKDSGMNDKFILLLLVAYTKNANFTKFECSF